VNFRKTSEKAPPVSNPIAPSKNMQTIQVKSRTSKSNLFILYSSFIMLIGMSLKQETIKIDEITGIGMYAKLDKNTKTTINTKIELIN
jgi:hypothetical protein